VTEIPPPSKWNWLPIIAATVLGGAAGWLISRSATWLAIGAVFGLAIAVMIVVLGVRTIVAVPVGVGAGIGAYVGATVVGVVCEPAGCPAFETTAGVTTGIGALVGIGLVVGLVARSFDEYRDSRERGMPAATSSCSVDDRPRPDEQSDQSD
jgi:hypothetical protein